MMFGDDASGKLLETTFKKKIIQQCRKLPSSSELEELLLAADPPEDGTEADDFGKLLVRILMLYGTRRLVSTSGIYRRGNALSLNVSYM